MSTNKIRLAALLLLAGAAPLTLGACATPVQSATIGEDMKNAIDSLLAMSYPADGPGAVVVVTRGDRIVYSGGQGLADVASGRRLDSDDQFGIGSITKQFTVAAILQLADEGKISLDGALSRYFPDWPAPSASATVRQLLNHTSGILDYSKIPGFLSKPENRQRDWTTAQLVALMKDEPASFAPGTRFEYNNGAFVLLGAILEQVENAPWHEVVRKRVIEPLDLETVSYVDRVAYGEDSARGYTMEGDGWVPARIANMSVAHASGALFASPRDVAKFVRALHRGELFSIDRVSEMIASTILPDGQEIRRGFAVDERIVRGMTGWRKGGAMAGYRADSAYFPDSDMTIVVLANADDPQTDVDDITRRVAAIALGDPYPVFRKVDVAAQAIVPILGSYEVENSAPIFLLERDGRYFVRIGRGREIPVFAAGDDTFVFEPAPLTWVEIERRPDNRHVMTVYEDGELQDQTGVWSAPPPEEVAVPITELEPYVGTYDFGGFAVKIFIEDGNLMFKRGEAPARPMRPLEEGGFMVDALGAKIDFVLEGGSATSIKALVRGHEYEGKRIGD